MQSEKTIWRLEIIKIDFDWETGEEYSTIVQIIMKADHGKAIAWCSVSCKVTCYHILDKKTP